MHPVRVAIIIIIILILAYIAFSIYNKKQLIENMKSLIGEDKQNDGEDKSLIGRDKSLVEGFGEPADPKTEIEILRTNYENSPLSIKGGIPNAYLELPIREFIVKSSYNSAISGLFASKDAIKLVLERGCRLIDFEIFSRNNIEYVSYSGDPEYKSMGTENVSSNRLKLVNAFNTIATSAFSSPSPSTNDPLFILIRIKDNSAQVYRRVSKQLNRTFSQRLFKGTFNSGTPLRKIQGKVVIFFDTLSSPKWTEYDKCDQGADACLDGVIHLEAGTTNFPLYSYGDLFSLPSLPVNRNTGDLKTDINSFMIVQPPAFDAIKPPDPQSTIEKWHPQFLAYKFYQKNEQLDKYEAIFNNYGCAFVPMSAFIADANMKNASQPDK